MTTNRGHFTKHGFHLNNLGKDWLAKQIASQIESLVKSTHNSESVVPLKWKEEATNMNIENNLASTGIVTLEAPITTSQATNTRNTMINNDPTWRISCRNKKASISMSKDFLWYTQISPDQRKFLVLNAA
jgi:hypothetical protein